VTTEQRNIRNSSLWSFYVCKRTVKCI